MPPKLLGFLIVNKNPNTINKAPTPISPTQTAPISIVNKATIVVGSKVSPSVTLKTFSNGCIKLLFLTNTGATIFLFS